MYRFSVGPGLAFLAKPAPRHGKSSDGMVAKLGQLVPDLGLLVSILPHPGPSSGQLAASLFSRKLPPELGFMFRLLSGVGGVRQRSLFFGCSGRGRACWRMFGPCWRMFGPCWGHGRAMVGRRSGEDCRQECYGDFHAPGVAGPCWRHVGACWRMFAAC